MFGRDPRAKAVLELAMKQVEHVLREMQKSGLDLEKLKIKKYQKTHFTSCTCPMCLEANRTKDPHKRGLLEEGYKLFVGEGGGDE
ncbi:MAG: hypothetical protein OEW39_17175 [Deltaproteobacteria bacterium]|nr:hypothetical protein [Deltaproteobacteria bacterium]